MLMCKADRGKGYEDAYLIHFSETREDDSVDHTAFLAFEAGGKPMIYAGMIDPSLFSVKVNEITYLNITRFWEPDTRK